MSGAAAKIRLRCAVAGSGRVAMSLAAAIRNSGMENCFQGVYARSGKPNEVSGSLQDIPRDAQLVVIAVSDDAIRDVAAFLTEIPFSGSPVFLHCSGALGLDVLSPLQDRGYTVGSAHPLQTFPEGAGAEQWKSISVSLILNRPADGIRELFEELGSRVFEVTADQKKKLHIAAVFASNYLVALMQAAGQTAPETESDIHQILAPLVDTTLKNIREKGPSAALTGPLVRGDAGTVEAHLKSLKAEHNTEEDLYRNLARYTAEWMQGESRLGEEDYERLKKILNS